MAERDDQLITRFWGEIKVIDEHIGMLKEDRKSIVHFDFSKHITDIKVHFREAQNLISKLQHRGYKRVDKLEKMENRISNLSSYIPRLEEQLKNFYKKQEEREKYNKECDSNHRSLSSKVRSCESIARSSTDWKETREKLKSVSLEIKEAKLKKEQRNELREKLNGAFDELSRRQQKEREQYENECNRNYSNLHSKVAHCISISGSSKNFKETREELKDVQSQFKGKKLKKEQREELFKLMQKAFNTLSVRQDEDRKKYERECESNYIRMDSKVRDAVSLAVYSNDFKDARERIKSVKQDIFDTRPMKKEKKSQLIDRIKGALDRLNSRANAEYEKRKMEKERKRREWEDRMRERISKLEDSISRDRESLRYQKDKLYNVRPGRREHEIKDAIYNKIDSIESRNRSKESSLSELKSKLY